MTPMLGIMASAISGNLTPTAPVAGYNLWLDSSDASTFTFSSGTLVSQWTDKSANAYTFTQGTTTFQPTRNTTQNSKSTVSFATNDVLISTAASSVWKYLSDGSGATLFIVVKNTATGFNAVLATGDLDTSIVASSAYFYNKTDFYYDTTRGSSGQEIFAGATLTADSWNVYSGYFDQSNATTGDKIKIYKNSGAVNNSVGAYLPSSSNPQTTLQIGQASSFYPLTGQIAEIISYKSLLSDANRQLNVTYLKTKWGI